MSLHDSKEVQQRAKRFLEWDSRPDGFHQFRWLGMGGNGIAAVWSKVNEQGRIIDQVAVKDSYLGRGGWADEELRVRDPFSPLGWIPIEAAAMNDLKSDKVVKLIGYKLFQDRYMYRLYMEFCPSGDLNDLLDHAAERGRDHLPEPFVWYLLECFTEVALTMMQGDINTPIAGWTQYLHRDLKPENIFLGCRDKDNFAAYPVPKTGDFGLALRTSTSDRGNPQSIMSGTPYWQAPEMVLAHDRILSPSDVWVYGAICMRAMETTNFAPGALRFDRFRSTMPVFNEEASVRAAYSPELVDLVMQCVAFDADARPQLSALRTAIWKHTGGPGSDTTKTKSNPRGKLPDLADGMRHATWEEAPDDLKVCHVSFSREEVESQDTQAGQDVDMADGSGDRDGDVEMADGSDDEEDQGSADTQGQHQADGAGNYDSDSGSVYSRNTDDDDEDDD